MDKFITAYQTLKKLNAEGLEKFVKVSGEVPDGWQKIDDRISTVVFKGEGGFNYCRTPLCPAGRSADHQQLPVTWTFRFEKIFPRLSTCQQCHGKSPFGNIRVPQWFYDIKFFQQYSGANFKSTYDRASNKCRCRT